MSSEGQVFIEDEELAAEFSRDWDYGVPSDLGTQSQLLSAGGRAPPSPSADTPPNKKLKKFLVRCALRQRPYKTIEEGYSNHLTIHKMENVLTKGLPAMETVLEEAARCAGEVLQEWGDSVPSSCIGLQLRAITKVLQEESRGQFVVFVKTVQGISASACPLADTPQDQIKWMCLYQKS